MAQLELVIPKHIVVEYVSMYADIVSEYDAEFRKTKEFIEERGMEGIGLQITEEGLKVVIDYTLLVKP